jgi:hypothetical protein
VLVAPNRAEWEPSRDQYDGFVSALKEAGLGAWLQEPRDGQYAQGGVVTDPLIDLTIFLWEQVREETIGAIVALAIENLRRRATRGRRWRRKRVRRGVIYGPDGEVLRTFELPENTDP